MDKQEVSKRSYGQLSDIENGDDEVPTSTPALKKVKCLAQQNSCPTREEVQEIGGLMDNLEGFFEEDDDDSFGLHLDVLKEAEQYTLDLSSWKRCKILSIRNESCSVSLTVEDKKSGTKAKCILEPPWTSVRIHEGDIVSLRGVFDSSNNSYKVTSQDGMIVTDPDYLVSGTSVVGALYCQRRGVLQERFRGVDTDSKLMMIGTIVHELLQKILRNKSSEMVDIVATGGEYLNSKEMARMLYGCKTSKADATKEVETFYPKIYDFIKNHVVTSNLHQSTKKSEPQIHAIKDIEENIWCHQMGLKGKIDVTVEATCGSSDKLQLMPLELKTGRASFSAEHKGQLVLYEMMMNLVGHHVEKGILLYLREGKCAPVSSNRHMKRDLIMLRNEVAYYLSRGLPNTASEKFDLSKDILQLPDPLNNQHVCSRCPYSVICTAYLKHENRDLAQTHSIKLIAAESLNHLTDRHIDYFIRWAGLIFLEDEEARKNFRLKHLWTKSPDVRHKMGRAAINLKLTGRVFRAGDEYFHTFALDSDQNDSMNVSQMAGHEFLSSYFETNEYLICSTTTRVAVAAGRVVGVGKRDITTSLERDLSVHYPAELFHLDKYESQTLMTFNLTNIGVLLDNTERSDNLRRIIVECEKPTFSKTVPSAVTLVAKQILHGLNKHQKIAVLTAVGTKSYCLFKGLPGTGKTQTVIALIRLLIAMDKTILVTSNTHSAVDNVLKRLLPYGLKFMRLGSASRIDPALKDFTEESFTENCSTPEQLAAVYDSFKIVGVTCLGAAHSMLVQRTFDFCIVDEATQVFQSAVIRPLLSSEKFVLIGDPDQLPPVVKSRKAKDLGADESLFFRLDTEQACCVLPTQYRMNKTITKLANDLSYKGKLLCANEMVATASLKLPNAQVMQQKHTLEKWLLRASSSRLDLSVILINTLNTYKSSNAYNAGRKRDYSYVSNDIIVEGPKAIYENYCEAAVVFYTIMALLECGVEGSSIGVIAPFRAQVELLRTYLQLMKRFYESQGEKCHVKELNIEINTVDQYQGKDKDVILYSCTKSNNPDLPANENSTANEYEILEDHRRLTVAVTRAKKKLIILGDTQCLEKYSPFRNLFKCVPEPGKITLQEQSFGFVWSGVFNTLDALHDCDE